MVNNTTASNALLNLSLNEWNEVRYLYNSLCALPVQQREQTIAWALYAEDLVIHQLLAMCKACISGNIHCYFLTSEKINKNLKVEINKGFYQLAKRSRKSSTRCCLEVLK